MHGANAGATATELWAKNTLYFGLQVRPYLGKSSKMKHDGLKAGGGSDRSPDAVKKQETAVPVPQPSGPKSKDSVTAADSATPGGSPGIPFTSSNSQDSVAAVASPGTPLNRPARSGRAPRHAKPTHSVTAVVRTPEDVATKNQPVVSQTLGEATAAATDGQPSPDSIAKEVALQDFKRRKSELKPVTKKDRLPEGAGGASADLQQQLKKSRADADERWNAQVFVNVDFLKRRVKMHPVEMNDAVENAKKLFETFLDDRFRESKKLLNLPSPPRT